MSDLERFRAALEKIAEERQTLFRHEADRDGRSVKSIPVQSLTPAAIIAFGALGWGWDMYSCTPIKPTVPATVDAPQG